MSVVAIACEVGFFSSFFSAHFNFSLQLLTAKFSPSGESSFPVNSSHRSKVHLSWVLMTHTEWLQGVWLRHFSTTCAVHIEDCDSWWLSGCHSSVSTGCMSWVSSIPGDCWLFHFSLMIKHRNVHALSFEPIEHCHNSVKIYTITSYWSILFISQRRMNHVTCLSVTRQLHADPDGLTCPDRIKKKKNNKFVKLHYS